MIPRVQQVMQQARERVLRGNTRAKNKLLSVFEPDTEVIRKGKASKPTEFGKMVKVQEAENQIVIYCEVFGQRPGDSDLLIPSIEKHKELLSRVPDLAAADAGFFSAANETAAKSWEPRWGLSRWCRWRVRNSIRYQCWARRASTRRRISEPEVFKTMATLRIVRSEGLFLPRS